jgi:hypothetical protein
LKEECLCTVQCTPTLYCNDGEIIQGRDHLLIMGIPLPVPPGGLYTFAGERIPPDWLKGGRCLYLVAVSDGRPATSTQSLPGQVPYLSYSYDTCAVGVTVLLQVALMTPVLMRACQRDAMLSFHGSIDIANPCAHAPSLTR